jgi:hypothetical protein
MPGARKGVISVQLKSIISEMAMVRRITRPNSITPVRPFARAKISGML